MASARLFLNEKHAKKNGTIAVYALVHIANKSLQINTGISTALDRWDKKKGRVKGNTKDDIDNNLIIDRCLSSINQIFVRYKLQNRILTADLLLREYKNPSLYCDFYAFMEKKIKDRVKNKEIGAVSGIHHTVLLNKLKEFKTTLSFAEIDLKFITLFRNWCRISKNNSVNTIQKNFGYFRAYMNIALREEIISVNPLDLIQLKRIDVQRVFLTETELKKLAELYEKQEIADNLLRTLRHFLFMCLTGIRISDFIRMKKDNCQENTLKFIPHKTNSKKQVELHIPLIEKAKRLIREENSESGFLFNAISEQKMNSQLKDISELAGIKKEISNHSARHTFATLFLDKTSDVATLQKLLGHSNISETMTYVHISTKKVDSQMLSFGALLGI
jgi:integrase/recombinase XerD